MEKILNGLLTWVDTGIAIVVVIAMYSATKWLFNKQPKLKKSGTTVRQVVLYVLGFIGFIIILTSLPIKESVRGQLLNLIGIIISAAFVLSSTTLLGNALAGVMNKTSKSFKLGDFIMVDKYFGRVTNTSLFFTTIQVEDRNLVTLPNLFIASSPLKAVRESGTIISTEVSLGYDISRHIIEKELEKAASDAGLKEPFVFITKLGDFSIHYKVHGLLEDTNKYFSTRALLNAMVVDHLHAAKIEIVSPSFMNQRQVNDQEFIPKVLKIKEEHDESKIADDLIFDKAKQAKEIEKKQSHVDKLDERIENTKATIKKADDKNEKEAILEKVAKMENQQQKISDSIEEDKDKLKEN